MKKSLRLSAAVAVAAAASLTLASCGFGGGSGSDDASGGATTLDLLVPSYSDNTQGLWEDVISGFEEENPDISVNLEVQSWDNLESVIATKIQGGEAPDIYNGGPFAGFAADGLLYPAEEVVSADTYSDFQESFLANAEVDGTAYALPLIASARALFVNNALLEQAGVAAPPTTWDELLDAATKISALGGGIAGYGMPLGSEEAQVAALFRSPRHPYTQGLLGAVPKLGSSLSGEATRLAEIPGLVPSLKSRIRGCVFAGRCPYATDLCREIAPALTMKGMNAPLLEVNDLKKHFPIRGGFFRGPTAFV